MKTNKLFILAGLAAIASTSCSQKENTSGQPAKPMNILYIMTDDHSFQTISAYDKRYIQKMCIRDSYRSFSRILSFAFIISSRVFSRAFHSLLKSLLVSILKFSEPYSSMRVSR